jgi:hypothetical protein
MFEADGNRACLHFGKGAKAKAGQR